MREKLGVRTHILLVVAMAVIIAVVTGLSLLLIRHHLRDQVTADLSVDLDHSVTSFKNLQAERLRTLEHENELLSQLPTLKALMTSGDDLTIQNEAAEFWRLSGADLFVLADPSGRIVAEYTNSAMVDAPLRVGVKALLASPEKHYLIDGGSLYACSLQPLYFGNDQDGTLLGYVVSGVSIERIVREISQPISAEAAFLSGGQVVASTLADADQASLANQSLSLSGTGRAPASVMLGDVRFLYAREDLSAAATSPLQLVVMKSFEPAERTINDINRMVMVVGLLALLSGTVLMIVVSRLVTRPLEELSRSVHAFALGDVRHTVPRHGTREVRELSTAFSRMRSEIQKANHAVLESERLATIGRMASSVSHDLRHYLAAIYANAEFLASDRFSPKERAEIFGEIRAAVGGTTEMLESLLIFSRTGANVRRQSELVAMVVERAAALVRTHPDADGVKLVTRIGEPSESSAEVDGKQIERAISNLLLNACQSARFVGAAASVAVTLESRDREILVNVTDNGPGVPNKIRESLFEPFVSEGKQKGTGLGLTLAHCVALEHGGEVVLLSSKPGETIFQMKVARAVSIQDGTGTLVQGPQKEVISNEKLRTGA
ncbi:MAG: ATP-binding protein [Terracidiphilus sp.]